MDADQWAEVERILDRLVDLEPEERELALSQISGDERVLDEVRSLLRAGARPPLFLSGYAAEFAAPAMTEPESPPGEIVDRRIGPYSIIRELGHGGMGIVYLAERQDVGKRVALKLVRDRAADQAYLSRFLFERQILAQLEHPNIAQLVDAGVADDGTPWFAMEYVDGTPVTRHCD
ncbi:MAG TPA: protein kinase, partial [Rhodothermales bacterium]